MKVFVFDLLAYGEQLDHLKIGSELPYPLAEAAFQAGGRGAHLCRAPRRLGGDRPARLRRGRLQRASLLALRADELAEPDGRSGGAAHQAPQAADLRQPAAAARAAAPGRGTGDARLPVERTADLRLRPRHPARIPGAQRAAGRLARPLRGSLRHHHPRLDRGRVLLPGPISGPTRTSALWPRPVQQPHPPIWMPIVGSKESIEFAARAQSADHPRPRPLGGLQDDIIRYYANCLERAGHRITPDHLSLGISAYVADSKAQAVREMGPYHLYFNRTLFSHGNFTETEPPARDRLFERRVDRLCAAGKPARRAIRREDFRNMTMDDVERQAEEMPWGTAEEVTRRIIDAADSAGANTVQVSLNRGVLPHEMFLEQIRRFARDVLPVLQAHRVARVPLAEEVAA